MSQRPRSSSRHAAVLFGLLVLLSVELGAQHDRDASVRVAEGERFAEAHPDSWTPIGDFAEQFLQRSGTEVAALAIVVGGATRYVRDFGTWSVPSAARVSSGNRLPLAAGTSPFATLALLQLADLGFADLEAPIVEHWSEGLPDVTRDRPLRTFLWRHSDTHVLRHTVEQLSGLEWQEYLSTFVFGPLEMADTGTLGPGGLRVISTASPSTVRRDLGLSTTARDLARFLSVWLERGRVGHRFLLSPAMVTAAFEAWSHGSERTAGRWHQISIDGRTAFVHAARMPNASSHLLLVPSQGLGIVLLTSRADGPFRPAHRALLEELTRRAMAVVYSGGPPEPPSSTVSSRPRERGPERALGLVALGLGLLALVQLRRWYRCGSPLGLSVRLGVLAPMVLETAVAISIAECVLLSARRSMGGIEFEELWWIHPRAVATVYAAVLAVLLHAVLGALIRNAGGRRSA